MKLKKKNNPKLTGGDIKSMCVFIMVLLFYKEHVCERRGESFSSRNIPVLKASTEQLFQFLDDGSLESKSK